MSLKPIFKSSVDAVQLSDGRLFYVGLICICNSKEKIFAGLKHCRYIWMNCDDRYRLSLCSCLNSKE